MKDIPIFQTEYGVASLVLSQIPMRQEAYVRLQAVSDLEGLLEESKGFCRACGAQRVFCTGHEALSKYPLETAIILMIGQKSTLSKTNACLWPVLPENVAIWRQIYNEKMAPVPHAALFSSFDEQKLFSGGCYFVHREGKLLGIGRAEGDTLSAVASMLPGSGSDIVSALASTLTVDIIRLEVASANKPALRLYEKLGFLQVGEGDRWYQIL